MSRDKDDTIAAIGTPPGTGGIAIVRVSGEDAVDISGKVLKFHNIPGISSLKDRTVRLARVVDPESGEFIDECIVIRMNGPRSYTGEDTVEIQCHGGRLVSEKVLAAILCSGARLAGLGEFTRRAYLNGRITLEQAEAVVDLVYAKSEASLAQASRRLRGELGAIVKEWEEQLTGILASLMGSMDFPEDVMTDRTEITKTLEKLARTLENISESAVLGLALSQGVEICIIGRPNVGKSALFNALLRQDRAIVAGVAGTTRDVLREHTQWGEIPVILMDTAGIRDTEEIVELMGVEKAKTAASQAEVVLYVVEAGLGLTSYDLEWLEKLKDRRYLLVVNKTDIARVDPEPYEKACAGKWVGVSSITGEGLEELKAKVVHMFDAGAIQDSVLLGTARQVDCIRRAKEAVNRAMICLREGWTDDVVVLSLEEGAGALAEISGKKVSEEVLDQIFTRFCVGK
jgi:tRNA modification GTPase